MAKERKLPKIGVATAKLYQNAGFGMIANEMPFMCRVQHELRLKGVYTWIYPERKDSFTARMTILRSDKIVEPTMYIQENFSTYEEALLMALEKGLNLLIYKNN